MVLSLYIPVVIGGYFVYGDNINPNVVLSLSRGPLVSFANILMAVHLILAFFIVINPVCQEVEEIFEVPLSEYPILVVLSIILYCEHFSDLKEIFISVYIKICKEVIKISFRIHHSQLGKLLILTLISIFNNNKNKNVYITNSYCDAHAIFIIIYNFLVNIFQTYIL